MSTWFKIYRKLTQWEWYKNSEMVHLFIHLISNAQYADTKWRGISLKRGQLVTSRKNLSYETGISEQSIRTCLQRLKLTNEITIQSTNRNSIITISNYEQYQGEAGSINQPINQQTHIPPTSDQPTIIKERKESKENNRVDNLGCLFDDTNKHLLPVVADWFAYKKSRRESYKSDQSKRAFITKLKNLSGDKVEIAKKIIEQSMANNWAGIFELKETKQRYEEQPRKVYENF